MNAAGTLIRDVDLPSFEAVGRLTVIALFLIARLLRGQTIKGAARTAPPPMPYQRGQFWFAASARKPQRCAPRCLGCPQPLPRPTRLPRPGHARIQRLDRRSPLLFAGLRCHRLGWPRGLDPDGRGAAFSTAAAPA